MPNTSKVQSGTMDLDYAQEIEPLIIDEVVVRRTKPACQGRKASRRLPVELLWETL